MAAVKVLKKCPMVYNGVFGCHGNTCCAICIGAFFSMIYSIGPINVCTDFEINQYKIDELENMHKSYILFDVKWSKNGTSYVMGAGYFWWVFRSGTFWNQPEVSSSKVMA